MKKHLLIPIAAAVIIAVVLCTAGCVSPADTIAGKWYAESDTAVTYVLFEEGGTGYIVNVDKDAGEDEPVVKHPLEWKKADGKNMYTVIYAEDGTTETGTLNADRGLLSVGEMQLEKLPNDLSGLQPGLSVFPGHSGFP